MKVLLLKLTFLFIFIYTNKANGQINNPLNEKHVNMLNINELIKMESKSNCLTLSNENRSSISNDPLVEERVLLAVYITL